MTACHFGRRFSEVVRMLCRGTNLRFRRKFLQNKQFGRNRRTPAAYGIGVAYLLIEKPILTRRVKKPRRFL